jgi:hypothetical protein
MIPAAGDLVGVAPVSTFRPCRKAIRIASFVF